MRLWIRSDLHRSLYSSAYQIVRLPEPETPYDVVVLAGDISTDPARVIREVAEEYAGPIVYVAGNHEFYGGDFTANVEEAREESGMWDDIHFLENSAVEMIAGDEAVRFLGCTLWTDFDLYGFDVREKAMQDCRRGMNDFRQITEGGRPLTPQLIRTRHLHSRAWLEDVFAEPWEGKTVVVTHHAPSFQSIHSSYAGDGTNAGFASDLEEEIGRWQPDLWIHGHTHTPFDYRIGRTRVVCNPTGYSYERHVNGHDPFLVVEV